MEKNGFEQILEQLAQANGTSPLEVRRKLQLAMDTALDNPDPGVRAMWDSIPRQGQEPTLDEFMEYLIDQNQLLP